tara:strand:- start:68 stop:280 length:213 start_codon:yes stop_codon:yes gene_type:complete
MDNDEALAMLTAKRTAVNGAINGIGAYRTNKDEWKTSVVTAKMDEVRAQASAVDVDLTDWDGSDSPPEEE